MCKFQIDMFNMLIHSKTTLLCERLMINLIQGVCGFYVEQSNIRKGVSIGYIFVNVNYV